MSNTPPPVPEKVIDEQGQPTLPWLMFFNNLFTGDTGTEFAPTFTNLTISGTPTITGKYYKLSQSLCYFMVTITPSTSTSSSAGSTYINNFPIDINGDGICFAVSGNLGTGSGHVVASSNRIYVPAWSAVTVPLTIIGIMEAR